MNYSMADPAYWVIPAKYEHLAASSVGLELSFFFLGRDDPETPVAIVNKMEAGYIVPRHTHECERFEVVVQGSLDAGDKTLYAGDVMIAEAGEYYGPKVCGPDGCTTIEILSTQAGGLTLHFELDDGTDQRVVLTGAEQVPRNLAGMDWATDRRTAVLEAVASRNE